jgi:hypothetical protein
MFSQFAITLNVVWMLSLCAFGSETLAQQPEPQPSAYDAIWEKLKEPLANRQYGAARELLEAAAKSAESSGFQERIAEDDRDISLLQGLKTQVVQRCRGFQTGATVEIGSVAYEFVRFESDLTGDRLVLRMRGSGRETERALEQVPARSWVSLAVAELEPTAENRYVIGIFYAVDRTGDRAEARKLLSAAAADGQQVGRWLARLDEPLKETKTPVTRSEDSQDPIVGTWRVVVGEGKHARGFSVIIKPRGTTNLSGSRWLLDETTGTYTLTLRNGATARVRLDPAQSVFHGRNARGDLVRGVRQVGKFDNARKRQDAVED